jgi:hypothetical protein
MQELKDIKQSHPLLRLGIENRGRRILEHHGLEADIFEDSAEIDELIQRLF